MRIRHQLVIMLTLIMALGFIVTKADTAFAASSCTTPTYLHISEDAEINSKDPFVHYTTSVYAEIGREDTYGRTYRFLVKPDISGLSKKARITSATLHLAQVSTTWDQDGLYNLHSATQPWSAGDITWASQPTITSGYVKGTQGGNEVTFDVLTWMKAARWQKIGSRGFLIKKPTETGDNNGLFAPNEYGSGGTYNLPYIEVCLKK